LPVARLSRIFEKFDFDLEAPCIHFFVFSKKRDGYH